MSQRCEKESDMNWCELGGKHDSQGSRIALADETTRYACLNRGLCYSLTLIDSMSQRIPIAD